MLPVKISASVEKNIIQKKKKINVYYVFHGGVISVGDVIWRIREVE